jgi:CDP-diglyceride synthetase
MLKIRVITAVVLLAILLPILYVGSSSAFGVLTVLFFGAGMWECQRLFRKPAPVLLARFGRCSLRTFAFTLRQMLRHISECCLLFR